MQGSPPHPAVPMIPDSSDEHKPPEAQLEQVNVDQLDPHPDNPRIVQREDVVAGIVANLNGAFPKMHALIVRPVGDRYQILSGHHRWEASKQAGLDTVWAWVRAMDDDEAFMLLATSNNQDQLSPLEIGLHALKGVPREAGGRGKTGGLSAYAKQVGKKQPYITRARHAAEVAFETHNLSYEFIDKANHLAAIHRLPRACWGPACQWLADMPVSAAEVDARVTDTLAFLESWNPGEWADYLDPHDCAGAVLTSAQQPQSFQRLRDLASQVKDELTDHADLQLAWITWLEANVGGDSWDIATVQQFRIDLEQRKWDREHSADAATDEVALLLADPPWKYDFSETSNRQIENQYPSATVDEICAHIDMPWAPNLADDCVLFLWATAPKLREALLVMDAWGFAYKTHAVWDKEKIGMGYWFRGQHELLLVGTRGNVSPPESQDRVSSVFREVRGRHSAKPECVYAAIEAMFPSVVKAEMYQRTPREGWLGYGNEARDGGA